ncbi:NEDD4-binding protein 2 [Geranomyces michiganensis]|nr:NEDD4-binding protein 2 [Geranomyces michiganensis]
MSSCILYILRGAPGSGKSTLARSLSQTHVFSTDDYFELNETGTYVFDPSKLSAAHAWNQRRARTALADKVPIVVIDNTHMCKWEARPYVEAALSEGYSIQVIEPRTPWWVGRDVAMMAARNTHGVDSETIERMLARFEPDFSISAILAAEMPIMTPPRRRHQPNQSRPYSGEGSSTNSWRRQPEERRDRRW